MKSPNSSNSSSNQRIPVVFSLEQLRIPSISWNRRIWSHHLQNARRPKHFIGYWGSCGDKLWMAIVVFLINTISALSTFKFRRTYKFKSIYHNLASSRCFRGKFLTLKRITRSWKGLMSKQYKPCQKAMEGCRCRRQLGWGPKGVARASGWNSDRRPRCSKVLEAKLVITCHHFLGLHFIDHPVKVRGSSGEHQSRAWGWEVFIISRCSLVHSLLSKSTLSQFATLNESLHKSDVIPESYHNQQHADFGIWSEFVVCQFVG